jgi:hypothetical protein
MRTHSASYSAIMRQPFEYLTELQCHSAVVVAPPGEAGRLCFISSNLAGCSLARIVEEELIAVKIIDHQKQGGSLSCLWSAWVSEITTIRIG